MKEKVKGANESYANQKLLERKNSGFELSEITNIVQQDLDRRSVGADSYLIDDYNYWKARCDNKEMYNQTSKEEVKNQITNLFEKIKNLKDDSENFLYQNHLTAIGFLENNLIGKFGGAESKDIPDMVLQVITFFDQIEKIETSERKEHFLQQFPMKEKDDYNCSGGFSARLGPILMILNSSNEAAASAHLSAVLASPLNKGNNVHNASLISAINNISLGDEYYFLPIQQKSAQDLWEASINYITKIQEQFSNNQAIVKKDLLNLATIFDERKKELFEEKLNKKSESQEKKSLRKYTDALEDYALKDAGFYAYDEHSMPVDIIDSKVQAELDKRIPQYYPLGIKEHPILSDNIENIKLYESDSTKKFIFDILNTNYKKYSIDESHEEIVGATESKGETPEETNYKIGNSVEEISVNDYPLKLLALNYLWIGCKKYTNPLEPILLRSEKIVLDFLEKNKDEQKIIIQGYCSKLHDDLLKSFDEKQTMSDIKIADIGEEIENYITNFSHKNNQDLLFVSAQNGHLEAVNQILRKKLVQDLNQADRNGDTALIIAAEKGHKEIVDLLLDRGAKPNQANRNGDTALIWAAEQGHKEIVDLLLDRGANPNQAENNGDTALIWAVVKGHKEIVELLLKKEGVDPNQTNIYGVTALILAAQKGHEKVVELLLKKEGVDSNKPNKNGEKALIIAAQKGHKEIVESLLNKEGVDPNQTNIYGDTALILAAQEGHEKVVESLLDRGVDPNQPNKDGVTALIVAAYKEHEKVVGLLLRHGVDFRNDQGAIRYLGLSDLLVQCQNIENCAQQISSKIATTNNFSQNAIEKLNPLIYRSLCKNVFISNDPQSINNSIQLINSKQDSIAENLSSDIAPILRKSKSIMGSYQSFDHLNQDNVSIINEAIEKFFNTQTNESENTNSKESGGVKIKSIDQLNTKITAKPVSFLKI